MPTHKQGRKGRLWGSTKRRSFKYRFRSHSLNSKLVEKLIVADISPISDSPHLLSTHSLLQSLQKIKLPTNITLSKCRLLVDKELSNFINNKELRAFLLTNLVEKSKGNFQWRINIPVLLANFNHLAKFPILNDLQYDGPTLFVAGGNSDFINSLPKHESIELAYNSYEFTNTYSEDNPEPTPLIVLHGLLGTKNNWNTFSKRLHKDTKAKIIAVDARNHGDSPHYREHDYDAMAVDLKNYIEKMKLTKVNLLGHAMGGRTAMLFALKYPELVEKLIVADISPISTSPNAKTIPRILQSLKQIQIPPTKSLREARKIIAESLFNLVKNKLVLGFLLTNLVQKIDGSYGWRFNTKAILENYDKISTFPETFNISFEGPTLFVGGLKSDYLPKSDFPQIKKLFPNAELKFIEGAGHWLHSEKPAEFLSITLEFLNRKDTS